MGFNSKPTFKRIHSSTVFGHIPDVPVNSTFENRLFLHHTSVHSGILAGIAGNKHEGCYSVVLNGGYEDDKDKGYSFTYTGCGGRDQKNGEKPREGPQTCDQSFENSRNASLRVSAYTRKPVRVVRGYNSSSDFAPAKGYRYDGLYVVEKAWMDTGKSGYKVCKYALTRLPDQPPIPRRQGTLNLDLSEWEQPRHFGKDTQISDDDNSGSNSDSSRTPTPSKKRRLQKGKAKAVPLTRSGVPLIRRPKDSDTEDDAFSAAGPSYSRFPYFSRERSRSPPRRYVPPPAEDIPPTTNVLAAERKHAPAPQQASIHAPVPDVMALLAEMSGSAMKLGSSAPRPCPTAQQSRPTGSAQPSARAGAGSTGHPKAPGVGENGRDVKRARFE